MELYYHLSKDGVSVMAEKKANIESFMGECRIKLLRKLAIKKNLTVIRLTDQEGPYYGRIILWRVVNPDHRVSLFVKRPILRDDGYWGDKDKKHAFHYSTVGENEPRTYTPKRVKFSLLVPKGREDLHKALYYERKW